MVLRRSIPQVLAGLMLLLVATPPLVGQRAGDALTLRDALDLAARRSPRLEAARHGAVAAELREPAASALPDPQLQIGFMNFGLPEFNSDMAMSMAPSIQLTQTLPWPGKLGRQEDVALRDRDIAGAQFAEASWRVRAGTAALIYRIWSIDRRLEVMRSTLELLEGFRAIALAMYGTGSGPQADVLRADVEIARTTGEIRRMEGQRAGVVSRLNGALDRPASTPVPAVLIDPVPRDLPSRDTLETWALESRPLLAEAQFGIERASAAAARADREIWPDLRIALAYGQRDRGLGTERMGSAMVGLTLPLFAGSRQHALRDAALADARIAEARHGEARAEVRAAIGVLLADLEATRALVDLYREEVVPQARTNVESALSAYRVGRVDFLTLVDAQTTANRYEGELFALFASYGEALSALESTVGRIVPYTDPALRVDR